MTDTSLPTVSVIMGVYNAERTVRPAIASILNQSFEDFEFIIVDDGSTDLTGSIVAEYVKADSRVRVIQQSNQGLTRSLITGSTLARGRYLARQDADDISMPSRLQKQVEVLDSDPECVLVTSWVEDVSPEDVRCGLHQELRHVVHLRKDLVANLVGVAAHGSVMMRRVSFDQAGGYRSCFYYAQDSDLWLRLSELGKFVVVPEILYRRVVGTGTISSRFRLAQSRFCELAQDCFRSLKAGKSDEAFIAEAELLAGQCRASRGDPVAASEEATSLLLLASQLSDDHPKLAQEYLWKAIRICPLHLRVWKALLVQAIKSPTRRPH